MDKVECLGEHPLVFRIVDFELAVRGHVFGLDGTEVAAGDASRWVLVREFDGPYACSCSNIENVVGGLNRS